MDNIFSNEEFKIDYTDDTDYTDEYRNHWMRNVFPSGFFKFGNTIIYNVGESHQRQIYDDLIYKDLVKLMKKYCLDSDTNIYFLLESSKYNYIGLYGDTLLSMHDRLNLRLCKNISPYHCDNLRDFVAEISLDGQKDKGKYRETLIDLLDERNIHKFDHLIKNDTTTLKSMMSNFILSSFIVDMVGNNKNINDIEKFINGHELFTFIKVKIQNNNDLINNIVNFIKDKINIFLSNNEYIELINDMKITYEQKNEQNIDYFNRLREIPKGNNKDYFENMPSYARDSYMLLDMTIIYNAIKLKNEKCIIVMLSGHYHANLYKTFLTEYAENIINKQPYKTNLLEILKARGYINKDDNNKYADDIKKSILKINEYYEVGEHGKLGIDNTLIDYKKDYYFNPLKSDNFPEKAKLILFLLKKYTNTESKYINYFNSLLDNNEIDYNEVMGDGFDLEYSQVNNNHRMLTQDILFNESDDKENIIKDFIKHTLSINEVQAKNYSSNSLNKHLRNHIKISIKDYENKVPNPCFTATLNNWLFCPYCKIFDHSLIEPPKLEFLTNEELNNIICEIDKVYMQSHIKEMIFYDYKDFNSDEEIKILSEITNLLSVDKKNNVTIDETKAHIGEWIHSCSDKPPTRITAFINENHGIINERLVTFMSAYNKIRDNLNLLFVTNRTHGFITGGSGNDIFVIIILFVISLFIICYNTISKILDIKKSDICKNNYISSRVK